MTTSLEDNLDPDREENEAEEAIQSHLGSIFALIL